MMHELIKSRSIFFDCNDNQIANLGSPNRDGEPTGTGGINLAVDACHSTFTDTIPRITAAQVLPDMQSSSVANDSMWRRVA
jgi:hypothetical protein